MAREIERLCGLPENSLDEPFEQASGLVVPFKKPQPDHVQYELEPVEVWDDETPLGPDEVELPFLKEVEVSGGPGSTAIAEHRGRFMRFGKMSLRKKNVDAENAVFVTVTGNSMEPVLRSGSTVGVDRGRTAIIDGDMYAIDHNGQLRVKVLYRLPGGGVRLRSYNRDEHPDEEYGPNELAEQNISIIGRVWWMSMYF
ncbi:S24 family peptidase [Pseudomonas tohonis]|uniref:S24 family peptidase n=1 Tax=Pseudomonas tohonis TaxID=2725477 RepID=UPI0035A22DBC